MQHDLENLGPGGFQDLVAALMVAEFGARLRSLGAGRDGGRDMLLEGSLDWTGQSRAKGADLRPLPQPAAPVGHPEVWSGYSVFQAKHRSHLSARPIDNARWLWQEIRKELELWTMPGPGRNRSPDHLVFVTNVPLSPAPGNGGLALIERGLDEYRAKLEDNSRDVDARERRARLARLNRMQHIRVIDGNEVDALVSVNGSVRQSFNALLTPGDVFASLAELLGLMDEGALAETLMRHARVTLARDGEISFDEAGGPMGKSIPIDRVAIDLPIHTGAGGEEQTLLRYVLERGERVLRPQTTLHQGPRHLVVTGPMGNGKTTMSKFLVQAYRASILQDSNGLGESASSALTGVDDRLRQLGLNGMPKHRRWPMRVDLAAFAEDEGQSEQTLLRYISHLISRRTSQEVKPAHMDTWMARWPWFLVLDGLDEVTEPRTRRSIIDRVLDLVNDADNRNLDLLVVLTTRPVGYTEDIAPNLFEQVDLAPLPIEAALAYGRNVVRARLGEDHEDVPRIERALSKAAATENTKELMVTPLQVLILTIIIEAAGPLPPDRFALFWGYYETVARRERGKAGSLKEILDAHYPSITLLHERVGFELHLRSQSSEHATATMSSEELRDLIAAVLVKDGHDPDGADADLVEEIRKACLQRLLLIRAHNDGVGFDVRALQEMMAGRFLTTGPDNLVATRLRKLASHHHWRIPWIFAAGRVFADSQPHRRDQIVEIVMGVDDDASWRLGIVTPVGPDLALDLAVDGGARKHPRVRKPLLDHALKLFDGIQPKDALSTTRLLLRAAGASSEARSTVASAFRTALGGNSTSRQLAHSLQSLIPIAADEVSASEDVRMLASVKSARRTDDRPDPGPDLWWSGVLSEAKRLAESGKAGAPAAYLAIKSVAVLRATFPPGVASSSQSHASEAEARHEGSPIAAPFFDVEVRDPILLGLEDPHTARLVEDLLRELTYQDPNVAQRLRDWVLAVRTGVAWEREELDTSA